MVLSSPCEVKHDGQEAAWLSRELPAELRGKKEWQRGWRRVWAALVEVWSVRDYGLGKATSVRIGSGGGLKSEASLYGYSGSKMKTRVSANLLCEGARVLGTQDVRKG